MTFRGSTLNGLALLLCCGLLGCSGSATGPQTGTLAGTVTLEGASNHAGITVAAYEPATLDSLTETLTRQYLDADFLLSQPALFDHRKATPVAETTTDADGSFRLAEVPTGTYNLVAREDGFGWRYVYDVSVGAGTQSVAAVQLLAERQVSGALTENTTWEAHRHYIVTSDLSVPEGVTLTIEEGVVVRFASETGLTVAGGFRVIGNRSARVVFTSKSTNETWEKVEILERETAEQFDIAWAKFEFGQRALSVEGRDGKVTNSMVKDCAFGGIFFDSSLLIQNSLITDCDVGLRIENSTGVEVDRNIVTHCSDTGVFNSRSGSSISRSIFAENGRAIQIWLPEQVTVTRNLFKRNVTGLYTFIHFNSSIMNNTFEMNETALFFDTVEGEASIVATNNNVIENERYAVRAIDLDFDVDARNNWWGVTNESEIRAMIKETARVGSNSGVIMFSPARQGPVENALP